MAHTNAYALQHSDLNGFLFADVGVEASGMTLSVLSALARLGMDPWQEAGRLAKLPRTAAVEGLARIIAAMPASLWPLPAATDIAARLVPLLPAGGGASTGGLAQSSAGVTLSDRLQALLPGRAAAARETNASGTTARWAITLALLAVTLAGLIFSLVGPQNSVLDHAAATQWMGKPPAAAPASPQAPSLSPG